MTRKIIGSLSCAAVLVAAQSVLAQTPPPGAGQTYPSRPVRIIVPFAPGGNVDLVARAVAQPLSAGLGQQVIVENRPGSSGLVATHFVAKETADGGAGSARLGVWMCPGLGLSKSGAGRGTQGCVHDSWPGLLQLLPQTGLRRTSRSRPGSGL